MRLLIVEDNTDLAGLLVKALGASGWAADVAPDAQAASEMLAAVRYAAVVLDLGLPDRDGLSVLRELRARHDGAPVLILTARAGLDDRVSGLRAGADDYLAKPFATEELIARLEALLRRPGNVMGRVLRTGDVALDTEARQVTIAGQPELFSAQELRLLELLLRRSGRVVSKKHVEDELFGAEPEVGSNAVEVAVHRLRRRLEAAHAAVEIHTVRGVGYFIAETAA